MATKCPNCGRKLTVFDWKQTCPACGVNLMFHGFEERFYEDAKKAELGLAVTRVKWARVVACLLGGALQKARLALAFVPVLATLVSVCTLNITLPLYEGKIDFGLLGAVSAFSDGTIPMIMSLKDAEILGGVMSAAGFVGAAFALSALFSVLILLFELFCFAGSKVMNVLLCAFGALGFASSAAALFGVNTLKKEAALLGSAFSVKEGFGAYVLMAVFALFFAVSLGVIIKGTKVKYKEGDLYRVDISKKVKKGEIKLCDLPYPIFETEEEHAERMKAIEDTIRGKSEDEAEEAAKLVEEVEGK